MVGLNSRYFTLVLGIVGAWCAKELFLSLKGELVSVLI